MTYTVLDIDGIDDTLAKRLKAADIRTTEDLLKACRNQRGRKSAAMKTGIDEEQFLKWAHTADLFRVRGVAGQFVRLLSAAGVHSIKDLKSGKAERIADAMRAYNAKAGIAKVAPSIAVVRKWIDHAKTLKPSVTS